MKAKRSLLRRKQNVLSSLMDPEGMTLRATVVALTLVVGLTYVLQVNMAATKGYDIRELEQQKEQLQKQARRMKLEAVELQSVERVLAQMPEDERLVEAEPDAYVSTETTAVAAR